MPANNNQQPGPVSNYMGLGDLLRDQVGDETEELRKKRMAQLAARPVSAGLGLGLDTLGGPVSLSFGGAGGFAR